MSFPDFPPRTITPDHPDYPAWLKNSSLRECVLRVRGTMPDPKSRPVAIVGTRTPSWNGLALAKQLVASLKGYRTSVVSGLANGIDLACHQAALEQGIHTTAVIAQGINLPIGGQRGHMARQILANGGVLISPFPDGTSSLKYCFVRRNRVIAAMAVATIVVESRLQGGALYTAADCLEEGRLLLAPPGDILRPTAQGPNALLQSQSALPIWDTQSLPDLADLEKTPSPGSCSLPFPEHSGQLSLWQNFQGETLTLEEIAERSQRNLPELLSILSALEVRGIVCSSSGARYSFSPLEPDSSHVAYPDPHHHHLDRDRRAKLVVSRPQRAIQSIPDPPRKSASAVEN